MGAEVFYAQAKGKNAKEAFQNAVTEARWNVNTSPYYGDSDAVAAFNLVPFMDH